MYMQKCTLYKNSVRIHTSLCSPHSSILPLPFEIRCSLYCSVFLFIKCLRKKTLDTSEQRSSNGSHNREEENEHTENRLQTSQHKLKSAPLKQALSQHTKCGPKREERRDEGKKARGQLGKKALGQKGKKAKGTEGKKASREKIVVKIEKRFLR